jgi:predicted amidohydrolase YtcJ
LMQTAVTRRSRTGDVIGGDQAIDVNSALKAVTIDAAWQLFAEERVGSLEPGKYADFTIVDQNPLEADPMELDRIRVDQTWMGGVSVFSV